MRTSTFNITFTTIEQNYRPRINRAQSGDEIPRLHINAQCSRQSQVCGTRDRTNPIRRIHLCLKTISAKIQMMANRCSTVRSNTNSGNRSPRIISYTTRPIYPSTHPTVACGMAGSFRHRRGLRSWTSPRWWRTVWRRAICARGPFRRKTPFRWKVLSVGIVPWLNTPNARPKCVRLVLMICDPKSPKSL